MTLALKYRPISFAGVVGQRHVKTILTAMVRDNSMPPAIIFGGSRGTGKTSTARILAAALNCEQKVQGDACGTCPSCQSVQAANSLSVIEIDAASNGGVEEVRSIRDMCQYSHPGRWRVVLLDEAHSMSKEAFNALLKTLEEPPPCTVFVLLTTETDRILETVRSRSMLFDFRRLTQTDIVGRLRFIAEAEDIKASDAMLREISVRVQGGMRDAVMLLDQVSRAGVWDEEGFNELYGIRDVSESLFTAALTGDIAEGSRLIGQQYARTGDAAEMTNQLILLIRDLLVLRAGGVPEQTEAKIESRRALADRVESQALVRVIGVLWELRARVKSFEQDQRASMEMAFVLVSEALATRDRVQRVAAAPQAVAVAPESRTLDLDQVKQLLAS